MKKDVLITLRSIQTANGDSNETEIITEGTFSTLKNEGFRIIYNESAATGFEGSKTTVCCYGDTHASICRTGTAQSTLIIDKNKKQHCVYGTPYGELMMGIYTHSIVNKLDKNGGELYMKYTVDINSSYISDNEILIIVRPAPKKAEITE
ncbi:MAG: DUF1934 domain-containing protein [Oscillospiraceae bacterium]|nr:DUF1934 domain-containing protein [Oscillospiraceae bacterium]